MKFFELHQPFHKQLNQLKYPRGRSKIRIDNGFVYIENPCFYKFTNKKHAHLIFIVLANAPFEEEEDRYNITPIICPGSSFFYIRYRESFWPIFGSYVSLKDFEYVYGSYIDPKTLINSYNNDPDIAFKRWSNYFASNDKNIFKEMLLSANELLDRQKI